MEKQNLDPPKVKLVEPPAGQTIGKTATPEGNPTTTSEPTADPSSEASQVHIHPTNWHPNEIAWVLGLQKKVNEETHRVDYMVTNQNLLVAVINNLIHIYRTQEKARLGVPPGSNPFRKQ